MAYHTGSRQRPPQQRGYDDPSAHYNGHSNNGYGHDRRDRDRDLSAARRGEQGYENSYSPQDEYNGYNQNPWSNETERYGANQDIYGGQNPDRSYQDDRQYRPQPRKKPLRQDMDGFPEPRGSGRPPPGQRPQPGILYAPETAHGRLHGYIDQAEPSEWNQQTHGYPDAPSSNQRIEVKNNGNLNGMQDTYPPPSRDRAPDHAARSGNDADQLPRYMNGHAHRFSNDMPKPRPVDGRPDRGFATGQRERNGAPESRGETYQDKSPDTVAWDNPFPTFHLNSKQRPQGGSTSSHSSKGRMSFDDGGAYYGDQAVRPQTAEGIRQKGVSPNGYRAHQDYNGVNGHSDVIPKPTSSAPNRVNGRIGKKPAYPGPAGYERSQTMPAAIPDPKPESGLIPVDHSTLQEPAAVSGYYGSQGTGQGPGRPRAASRSQSDTRWGSKSAAKCVHTHDPRQQRFPPESRGEIVNTYQEEMSNEYPPYQQRRSPNQSSHPADDEMPNFGPSVDGGSRGRGMTIDDHLQPHTSYLTGHPRMLHRDDYVEPNPRPDPYYPGDIHRSRSQPDFAGAAPAKNRHIEGFDHAGSRPALYDRPATSAAAREYGQRPGRDAYGYPSRSTGPGGSSRGPPDLGGQTPGNGFGPHDRYGDPNNQQNGPRPNRQDRHRPPAGHHGRPLQDSMHSSGPRRSPLANNRGPPDDRPQQPDRLRSPPVQNGRPPPDRTQQLSNRPLASKHKGPSLSLDKPLPNPDALPHHPAPVRPGLNGGQSSAPNSRPAPVRQYNSTSSDPVQQSTSQSVDARCGPGLVTPQELEYLRQKTLQSPNDSATQFLLAQKLVEAADVLIDERADPSTRKRSRDRYQSDALKIIKKLSAISYTEADFYYADCYSRGTLGLPPDIKEAFLLYQKAAKANHAQAAYRVAVCCELGQEDGGGTKRDAVKAMQWYRRAATLGDVAAKYKMGVILIKGLLSQPRNAQEGVSWLKQAAEQADKENPHALHELAMLHEKPTGMDGIRQDEAYSRRLFTQSANLGYKFSQFRLGCAYEYGLIGCPVDPRQSIAWYSKAAVQEEHQSELALSGWYLTGAEGILQQSDTEAYLWARKAAQAGLAKAEYAMGYFTEVGIGAPANLEDAKRWYWKSASQHFPKARDRLEDLRRGGGPKQKTRVSRTNMRKQSDGECTVM